MSADGVATPVSVRRRPPGRGLKAMYGASPLHLLALLLCFVLGLYAVLLIRDDPAVIRIAVWFVGAALVWDLVLGPLLALVDRALLPLRAVGALNHARVPLLASALLLLVWAPVIFKRSQGIFRTKAGLGQDVFLGRWLAITAVLFAVSGALYAVGRLRGRSAASGARDGGAAVRAD